MAKKICHKYGCKFISLRCHQKPSIQTDVRNSDLLGKASLEDKVQSPSHIDNAICLFSGPIYHHSTSPFTPNSAPAVRTLCLSTHSSFMPPRLKILSPLPRRPFLVFLEGVFLFFRVSLKDHLLCLSYALHCVDKLLFSPILCSYTHLNQILLQCFTERRNRSFLCLPH